MVSGLSSAITVPDGFAVDTLIGQIDGQTPRLEAIRNPDYGCGVVAASMDNGILKVMRISQSSVDTLNVTSDLDTISVVGDIRFDTSGLFGNDSNDLFVTVWCNSTGASWEQSSSTSLMRVPAAGPIEELGYFGDTNDKQLFMLDFSNGSNGYPEGAYFGDYAEPGGTSFYRLDADYQITNLTNDILPTDPNRTDLDIVGMEFDRTGVYNSYLTVADSDVFHDEVSAIYQLDPNLADPNLIWSAVADTNSLDVRYYRDMCIGKGGSFGDLLYVTESVSETVMIVEPDGQHGVFASGFLAVQSITISEDGDYMYVSDSSGIYRIRAEADEPGPTIVMQEPKAASGRIFTDPNGVMCLRLIWSEELIFDSTDVSVQDEMSQDVKASVCGSGSELMMVTFERPLLYDKFTITIADTVVSAEKGIAIDGDRDQLAGGDAVIVMEHRLRADSDNNNYIDLFDLTSLAEQWLWPY